MGRYLTIESLFLETVTLYYTPLETEFLGEAQRKGLEVLSGYELFFYQGMDAFERFTGCTVDEERLRLALTTEQPR